MKRMSLLHTHTRTHEANREFFCRKNTKVDSFGRLRGVHIHSTHSSDRPAARLAQTYAFFSRIIIASTPTQPPTGWQDHSEYLSTTNGAMTVPMQRPPGRQQPASPWRLRPPPYCQHCCWVAVVSRSRCSSVVPTGARRNHPSSSWAYWN